MKHFFALLITFTFVVPFISANSYGGEATAFSGGSYGSYGVARREARRAKRVVRRTTRRASYGSHGSYSVGAVTVNNSKFESYDYTPASIVTCPDCEGLKAVPEDTSVEASIKSVNNLSKEFVVSVQRFDMPYLTLMKEKKVVLNAHRP